MNASAYTFKVTGSDASGLAAREYYLTYYKSQRPDQQDMVSLYDAEKKRTVLKPDVHSTDLIMGTGTKTTPFRLDDLRIGASVRLCGRDLKIEEYSTDNARMYFNGKPAPSSVDRMPRQDEEDVDAIVQHARSLGFSVGLRIQMEAPGKYAYELELLGPSRVESVLQDAREHRFFIVNLNTSFVPPGEMKATMKLVRQGIDEPAPFHNQGATSRLRRAVKQEQEKKRVTMAGEEVVPHSFSADGFIRFGQSIMLNHIGSNGYLICDLGREVSFGGDKCVGNMTGEEDDDAAPKPKAKRMFTVTRVQEQGQSGRSRYHGSVGKQYDRDDVKRLHYGQTFKLEVEKSLLVDRRTNMLKAPMRLRSEAANTTFQGSASASSGNSVSVSKKDDSACLWQVAPATNNSGRIVQSSGPVPANAPITLRHVMTNRTLVCDAKVKARGGIHLLPVVCSAGKPVRSGFGSLNSSLNANAERATNPKLWRFITALDESAQSDNRNLPKRLTRPKDILEKCRETVRSRNSSHYGIREIGRAFRILDDSGNGSLDRKELRGGLEDFGVFLDDMQFNALFSLFDRNNDGAVSIDEFLVALRGPLSKRRLKFILMAYNILDLNHDGEITKEEIGQIYDTSFHPKLISGEMTHEEIIFEFMAQWDTQDRDGIITKDEFVAYYRDVSASIDDDEYFELMMRNAWHISGGTGASANTSNIRCLVTHTDGTAEVVALKNDFGVRRNDMISIKRKLQEQGVRNIKIVSLAD